MITILRETHDTPHSIAHTLALAGGTNIFGEPNFRAVWGWNRLAWIGGRWTDLDSSGCVLRETIGLRYEPKYLPTDRWHIERWCAPEMYGSPEDWARNTLEIENGMNVPALGPYPSRGEYEHVFTLARTWSARGSTGCDPQQPRGPRTKSRTWSAGAPHVGVTCGGSDSRAPRNPSTKSSASRGASPINAPCGEFVQLTPTIAEYLARLIETSRAAAPQQSREALYRREAQRDRAYDAFADEVLGG
jgi:hypothetical protein